MAPSANFVDLCRICATETQSIVRHFIFEGEGKLRDLSKKIAACLPVKVKEDDRLPKVLCGECVYKLDLLHEFREKSQKTEAYLFTLIDPTDNDHHVKKSSSSQLQDDEEEDDDDDSRGGDDLDTHDDDVDEPEEAPPAARAAPQPGQICEPEVVIKVEEETMDRQKASAAATEAAPTAAAAAPEPDQDTGGPSSSKRPRRAAANKRPIREDSPSLEAPSSPPPPKRRGRKPKSQTTPTPGTSTSGRDSSLCRYTTSSEAMVKAEPEDRDGWRQSGSQPLQQGSNHTEQDVVGQGHYLASLNQSEVEISEVESKPNVNNFPLIQIDEDETSDSSSVVPSGRSSAYECQYCKQLFYSLAGTVEHVSRIHPKMHICNYCREKFRSAEALGQHKRDKHWKMNLSHNKPKKCPLCNNEYVCLESHMKVHLNEFDLQFNLPVPNIKNLNQKLKNKLAANAQQPNSTVETIKARAKALNIPEEILMKLRREKRTHTCEICGKVYNRFQKLKDHMAHHTGDRPFPCTDCEKRFINKYSLRSHQINKHGHSSSFVCSYCGKGFAQQTMLEVHERTHTGERPFVCSICHKAFASKFYLVAHQTQHDETQQFECDICSKKFSKTGLYQHKKTHLPRKKPHSCPVCNARFAEKRDVIRHIRTHTKERPYECDVCHKGFSSKYDILPHMRRHLGIKPHVCEICGKAFSGNPELVIHKRIHTGEKPHECHLCGQRFNQLSILRRHFNSHKTLPYQCEVCMHGFKTKQELMKHTKELHIMPTTAY